MAKLNVEISEKSMDKLIDFSIRLTEGKKGAAIENLINSSHIYFNGEYIPINEVLISPPVDLTKLEYRYTIRTQFRKNFNDLPFRYRWRIFYLFYILIHGIDNENNLRFNDTFLSVYENLNFNYTDPELVKIDPDHCTFINFYMNIKGKMGSDLIKDIYSNIRISKDPDSLIFISRFERFECHRYYDDNVYTIYDEILKILNIDDCTAIQLDTDDLDKLINYYTNLLPLPEDKKLI